MQSEQNILLQEAYISFVKRQIKQSIIIDDLKENNFFTTSPLSPSYQFNEVKVICWEESRLINKYEGIISETEARIIDQEIIKKRKIMTCPFLFSNCLLENPIEFLLNNQRGTKGPLMSDAVMRNPTTFLEVVKNNFSKVYNKSISVNKMQIKDILNDHFLSKNRDQNQAYENACKNNKILKGINNIFTFNEYLDILRKFKMLKDYAVGGNITQHINSIYGISKTDVNRIFIPPLKSLYEEFKKITEGIDSEGIDSEGIDSEGIDSEGIDSEDIDSEDIDSEELE